MSRLVARLERWLRRMRTTSPSMLALRVALALACAACVVCCGSAGFWTGLLVLLAMATVVAPGLPYGGAFMVAVLLVWTLRGTHPWPMTALLTAGLAGVHWAAIMCSRGPLQAHVPRSAFAGRAWLAWLAASVAGIALVLGVGALGSRLALGATVTGLCVAVVLAVLVALLATGRRHP